MNRRMNEMMLLGVLVFAFLVLLGGPVSAGTSAKPLAPITEAMHHATQMVISGQDGKAQDIAAHANAAVMLVRKIVFDLPKDNPHATEAASLLEEAIVHLQHALTFGFKGDVAVAHNHANEGLYFIERAALHVEPSHYAHEHVVP